MQGKSYFCGARDCNVSSNAYHNVELTGKGEDEGYEEERISDNISK